jgi:hypothetical protein
MKTMLMLLLAFLVTGCATGPKVSGPGDVPRMTKEDLKDRLKGKETVVLDVRSGKDWDAAETKIPGAVREDPKNFADWAPRYAKDKTTVLYCS